MAQLDDWVDEVEQPAKPVKLFIPKSEQERNATIADIFSEEPVINDWIDEKPEKPKLDEVIKPQRVMSPAGQAVKSIGSNLLENWKETATATGEAISEPMVNPNAPKWMKPVDATVRGIGKLGNIIGGTAGFVFVDPLKAATTASVENTGLVPAAAKAIKENLVPNDPRFTADLSPEQVHQVSRAIGGDLANAVYMGVGGIQGKQFRDIKAGIPIEKPYNPLPDIKQAVGKFEEASQKAPSILGYTRSGSTKPQMQPTIPADELRSYASAKFKEADAAGGTLSPIKNDAWIDSAKELLPRSEEAKRIFGNTPVDDFIANLENQRGKPMTLQGALEIDSRLGEMAMNEVHPTTGKPTAAGNKLWQIQQKLRDQWETATESDITGGAAGYNAAKEGRDLWAASARMNDIERILQRASQMEVPATGIR